MYIELSLQVVARDHFLGLLPLNSTTFYLPCRDSLWEASTAEAWAQTYEHITNRDKINISKTIYELFHPHAMQLPVLLDPTALDFVFSVFHSILRWQKIGKIPTGDSADDFYPAVNVAAVSALTRFRQTWLEPNLSTFDSSAYHRLLLRWNGHVMNCCANCDILEVMVGRQGAAKAFEIVTKLGPDWPNLYATRRSLLHAAHVLKHCQGIVKPQQITIWDFAIVFKAAVVCFCYSIACSRMTSFSSIPPVSPPYVLATDVPWDALGGWAESPSDLTAMDPLQSTVRFLNNGMWTRPLKWYNCLTEGDRRSVPAISQQPTPIEYSRRSRRYAYRRSELPIPLRLQELIWHKFDDGKHLRIFAIPRSRPLTSALKCTDCNVIEIKRQ